MPGLQARTSAAAGADDASRLRRPYGGQMWTDERIELLKKDWAGGFSASQIAGRLGGCTRNAVIGKANRLGLSQSDKPRLTFSRPKPQEIELPPDQSPCAVTFLQLAAHHCRWPIGDSPFMYCGARRDDGSYCLRHHRISYTKPERRGQRWAGQKKTLSIFSSARVSAA